MQSTTYEARWKEYKRANWAAGLWLVLGFPCVVLVAILLKALSFETGVAGLVVLSLAWAATWAVLCVRVTRFRCPRCNGLYFAHTQLFYGAGRKCAHCGLRLYEVE